MNDKLFDVLRTNCAGVDCDETSETLNLHLTREQFVDKMLLESDGRALLDLLSAGEWVVCERMKLIQGFIVDDKSYFEIPRWKNLVAHLRIVNSV